MRSKLLLICFGPVAVFAACAEEQQDRNRLPQADAVVDLADARDDAPADGASADAETVVPRPVFVAVTFNTGTTEGIVPPDGDNGGYDEAHAQTSDQWYGDGLAWSPAVEAARAWFEAVDPDVVVFQEIFYAGLCPDIPADAQADFVCATWTAGDPTVAPAILTGNWQVMCHPGKDDKCAAVHRRFGSFRGCDQDFCLEGMTGFKVPTCGSGARVARAVIDLVGGGTLTLVNFHGSSGFGGEEQGCRVQQVEQAFQDLGDGEPGANGDVNLVMGDFNTDPGRLAGQDPSAARVGDFVGEGHALHFVTAVGPDAPPTYAAWNIDHVISDQLTGTCWHAGVTEGHPAVLEARYFDHKPAVCTLEWPD